MEINIIISIILPIPHVQRNWKENLSTVMVLIVTTWKTTGNTSSKVKMKWRDFIIMQHRNI